MSVGGKVQISQRLQAICQMVTPGNDVVDVGCDHGFVSIYLVQRNLSPRVIAMDVRKGPLSAAEEHIRLYGLEDYIETRLSDGLCAYGLGEAQTLICAGMGGRLMQKILTEGQEKARALEELILQPQSEIAQVRRFLRKSGYRTIAENILQEEGKYYFLMKVSYAAGGGASYRDFDLELSDRYGGLLLAGRHPLLKQYLEFGLDTQCKIAEALKCNDNARVREKLSEVEMEIKYLKQALALY